MGTLTNISGKTLLMMLENATINPEDLTPKQKEQVLEAQSERRKQRAKARRRLTQKEAMGLRTRFGLASWEIPTETKLKKAKAKKKLRM